MCIPYLCFYYNYFPLLNKKSYNKNMKNMAEEIRRLIKLHDEGNISDSALDSALKALQPAQKSAKKKDLQRHVQRQLRRMRRRKNLRTQQKPLKI